jgi:hypothetical protein
VSGFELLKKAKERGVPAFMLAAHGLNEDSLTTSARSGAAYHAPKEKMDEIASFVADIIDA